MESELSYDYLRRFYQEHKNLIIKESVEYGDLKEDFEELSDKHDNLKDEYEELEDKLETMEYKYEFLTDLGIPTTMSLMDKLKLTTLLKSLDRYSLEEIENRLDLNWMSF